MSYYRTMKTTTGRRYSVRQAEDEKAERLIYWTTVTGMTFIGTILMMLIWVKGA